MSPEEIERRIAAGAYSEAAAALADRGELERAQALFERIWDFGSAAAVAQRRGDRPDLLRLLLEAKDLLAASQVASDLARGSAVDRVRAAEVYERRGMWAEAARFREATGDLEAAQRLYARGALPLEAARLEEALGRPREAGILYERFLAQAAPGAAPTSETVRAEAGLGRILAGFDRHEEAARRLQRALRDAAELAADAETAALVAECRRQLVVELAALGFNEGARQLLDELRAEDPRLEPLDAFLQRRQRGAGSGSGSEPLLAGRYQVLRLLGAGGMGRVYLTRDRASGREVAVKVVAPPIDARARDGYGRFVREARIVSALKHSNLVAVHEFHEELGLLVMEYMAGGTLAERLRPDLPPARVKTILGQVVAGLGAAHARGVIHRDIKPANVFFSATGEAKLGDFGVAHLQDLGATQTGGFIGTLAYMSPEQITGAKLTFACDVYALGVTAFQMLTGRLPFSGPDFVGQHLGAPPPTPSLVNPELGRGFDPLVLRMLAKDPGERFAALDELERAILAVELPDRPPGGAPRTGAVGADEERLAPEEVAAAGGDQRYRLHVELERREHSVVWRGVDERLDRPVLIEQFDQGFFDGEAGAKHLRWLRVMARHGGPHLQRVLRIDPSGRVVYEAPAGPELGWIDRAGAARVVLGACRGLAGAHAEGVAHGGLAPQPGRAGAVLLEETGPTLLVAGRGPTDRPPGDDLVELVALLARLGGPPVVDGAPVTSVGALAGWARAVLAANGG